MLKSIKLLLWNITNIEIMFYLFSKILKEEKLENNWMKSNLKINFRSRMIDYFVSTSTISTSVYFIFQSNVNRWWKRS